MAHCFILKMMEQFNSIDNYPFDKTLVKANLFKFLADQNLGRAWVIKSDNLIIGYIILAFGFRAKLIKFVVSSCEKNGVRVFV